MSRYKVIKCQWQNEKSALLNELGIDSTEFEYKDVHVNLDSIAFIEEYNGLCCINFSGNEGDCLITNIPFSKIDLLK